MTNEPLKRRIAELQPLLEKVIDQKIYIRLSAELGLTLHHGCGGFVAGSLSELIKEKLPDRFDGDRAVIILNEEQFSLDFDDADEQSLRAIICHEAGHVLDLWCGELPVYHIDAATLFMKRSGNVRRRLRFARSQRWNAGFESGGRLSDLRTIDGKKRSVARWQMNRVG